MIWSAADVLSHQGLQFAISVILARILGPAEYGTIALLYIFFEIASVFGDSGLSSSLVQRQDLTDEDESSVFWFHVISGLLLSILLCLAADWIAKFYENPILVPLMQIMAVAFFISTVGNIHHVLLTKRLDFKRPMKVSVAAGFMSGFTAIVMAFYGAGVWALAVQSLIFSMVTTSLLWALSGWRPGFIFKWSSIKKLFAYGGYLMLADLLMVTYNRIYTLYIGKVYSVVELGLYTRADNTKQIPIEVLSKIYARVAFPIFSQAAEDKQKLLRGTQLALRGMVFITFPIMAGLMVTAEEVVVILFGDKWVSVAPILEILCLAGVFWPIQIINMNVQKALGHSRLLFRTEILKKVIGIIFIIVALPYGIIGIAWSQVCYGVMAFMLNAYFTGRYIGYGVMRQFLDLLPVLLISTTMAVSVYLFSFNVILPPTLMLIAKICVGISIFLAITILFRLKILKEIQSFFLLKQRP